MSVKEGLQCIAASKQSQKDCQCNESPENTGILSFGSRVTLLVVDDRGAGTTNELLSTSQVSGIVSASQISL